MTCSMPCKERVKKGRHKDRGICAPRVESFDARLPLLSGCLIHGLLLSTISSMNCATVISSSCLVPSIAGSTASGLCDEPHTMCSIVSLSDMLDLDTSTSEPSSYILCSGTKTLHPRPQTLDSGPRNQTLETRNQTLETGNQTYPSQKERSRYALLSQHGLVHVVKRSPYCAPCKPRQCLPSKHHKPCAWRLALIPAPCRCFYIQPLDTVLGHHRQPGQRRCWRNCDEPHICMQASASIPQA